MTNETTSAAPGTLEEVHVTVAELRAKVAAHQGELPALQAPFGLTAKSLPAGEIEVSWSEVCSQARAHPALG